MDFHLAGQLVLYLLYLMLHVADTCRLQMYVCVMPVTHY